MVKICCLGAGYVGAPTMAVIALKCPHIEVAVLDISAARIAAWNSDQLPIYEAGLHEVVRNCRGKNLVFSTDFEKHIIEADIIFISVNTPIKVGGFGAGKATDLSYWESAARMIADVSISDKIVVEKGTVPVKTALIIEKVLMHNKKGLKFQVLSNPEFVAEGSVVQDLFNPELVVIGGRKNPQGQKAVEALRVVYANWVPQKKIISTNLWSAEISKIAENAFLAQRISSVNAVSALCEAAGGDVTEVANAIGRDSRIGPDLLNASVGFGGSNLKDILSLVYICECNGLIEVASYWKQVMKINDYQKRRFVNRVISSMFNTLVGKKVAILGFTFNRGIADNPAIDVCRSLVEDQANICIYDPVVTEERIQRALSMDKFVWDHLMSLLTMKQVQVVWDAYEATKDAHGVCILTRRDEFNILNYQKIYDSMQKPAFIFDGPNCVDVQKLREIGFIVYSIGKLLMVKICCVGAGYLGGPTMAVIALKCPHIEVVVLDISAARIAAWNIDQLSIYEAGLHEVVRNCRGKYHGFNTDLEKHIIEEDIVLISVYTPIKGGGFGAGKATDLSYWESAARMIADISISDKIVVEKVTVPVKTALIIEIVLIHNE